MRVKYEDLLEKFQRILESRGFSGKHAKDAATVFANNSLDGVYSHGVNRFPRVVEYLDKGQIADRVLFALFTPPGLIQIMREPIDKAVKGGSLDGFTTREQLEDLILGHEIYHYLEEEYDGIYTRTEKIRLWKILGFENRSTIRALSEIAGMYFSKKLNGFPYSPFALDILLYYNYNSETALNMYREVAEI